MPGLQNKYMEIPSQKSHQKNWAKNKRHMEKKIEKQNLFQESGVGLQNPHT